MDKEIVPIIIYILSLLACVGIGYYIGFTKNIITGIKKGINVGIDGTIQRVIINTKLNERGIISDVLDRILNTPSGTHQKIFRDYDKLREKGMKLDI